MRRLPIRSVRAISFEGGSPVFQRYTFGTLGTTGFPPEVPHQVKRRRSSANALD